MVVLEKACSFTIQILLNIVIKLPILD